MIDRLEETLKKYNEITEELTKEETLKNISLLTKLSKEQSDLSEIVEVYKNYKNILNNIEEDKELLKDNELKDIAKEELETLENEKKEIEKKLEVLLLPKDPNDGKNAIMEIRGAAGGDEGNIFAGDLFRMYQKYFEKQGFKTEIINAEPSDVGGYSQIEFLVKGDNVYSKLKYESGAHRVQRIPETESGGRIHTSTATVAILPEVSDVEIDINPADLKIDVYRSGGAGGQSVNTADSAVRITHIPTGVVVTCQNERSQIKNKERAMVVLKSRLYDAEMQKQNNETGTARKSMIGTGDRSEKIRTYNYPQNRVTDHRINFSIMELDRVMEGNLDPIIEALITEDQRRKMQGEE